MSKSIAVGEPDENIKGKGEAIQQVVISPPDMRIANFTLRGTSHLCVNRVSAKVKKEGEAKQRAGGPAKSKRVREAKNFEALCEAAAYRDRKEGWYGLHAACFRNASISACRTVGYKMVLAKLGIFTVADGYDKEDGTPLVRIYGPDPEMWIAPVRNATGVFDLRPRPRWNPGEWEIHLRLRFDAGLFTIYDVTNLLMRVGYQVGVGEGRPDSKNSAGLEYGLFSVAENIAEIAA